MFGLSRIGVAGGVSGFMLSFVSRPFIQVITPIAAAALVALALSHFDGKVRRKYGSIGGAAIIGLAFLIEPLENVARGMTRGIISLFATFLLTVVGYQLTVELHSRRHSSSLDDDETLE